MKFKINFESDKSGHDYYFVKGETIEEIREKVAKENAKRGISEKTHNIWSEEASDANE